MSTSVFPTLAGQGWSVDRTEMWSNTIQQSISGMETRVALWTYPRHQWDLTFDVLRQGSINGTSYTEYSQLEGFFNLLQGGFDTFLYADSDDNSVTAQPVAVGDGSTTAFQLVRSFGGFTEPVLAPSVVTAVYFNGVSQSSGSGANWDYILWGGKRGITGATGTSPYGYLIFGNSSKPGAGVNVTVDMSYYFPCRFADDKMGFSKFLNTLYACKKVSMISVKN